VRCLPEFLEPTRVRAQRENGSPVTEGAGEIPPFGPIGTNGIIGIDEKGAIAAVTRHPRVPSEMGLRGLRGGARNPHWDRLGRHED
jgi:hypothetical protein